MSDFIISLTNYEFVIPAEQTIIVLANYRTGSTALCDLLSQRTGLPFLGEVFHHIEDRRPVKNFKPSNPSIIKIMPNHMPPEELQTELFGNSYMIGLYRQDFAAQILSFAIAHQIGKWQQEKGQDPIVTGDIQIPNKMLGWYCKELGQHQTQWNYCRPFFDTTLCYEQLIPDLQHSIYDMTPQIDSYKQKLNYIRGILG
jgi:LPS sulfotransferase NodH